MKHLTKMKSWIISLFAVIALCNGTLQLEAQSQTDINFGNFSQESNAKFINNIEYHYFFEDILRFNCYPQHQDVTYRGGFTVFPEIEVNFYNHHQSDSLITINTSIDYIEVFYTDGTSNICNFAVDQKTFTATVPASSKSSFSFSFPVDILLDGFFYSPGTVNVQIHLKHQVDFLGDYGFDLTNRIIGAELEKSWLEYEIGKHDNPNEVTIINQNNTLINKLTSWFENLFKRMEDKQNELVNGFDTTTGDSNNQELSDNLDQVENVESSLTTDAFDGMNNYTITNDIMGYDAQFATAFPIVASMIQSVFDSSGEFGIILSVTFTVIIASMLIGLYRYYKE